MIAKEEAKTDCRLPDFFIIGAAKCGTTSLYFKLRQHPGVFMPEHKEPGYMCFAGPPRDPRDPEAKVIWKSVIFDREEYLNLFSQAQGGQRIGEATPEYLYLHQDTIRTIRDLYGPAARSLRFIAILRNPVDRIWSHYWMFLRDGYESLPFEQATALKTIEDRLSEGWHPSYDYVGLGRYSAQIEAWQEAFGSHAIKVLLFEELREFGEETRVRLCDFLGIDPQFVPKDSSAYNVSGRLKHPWIHHLLFRRQGPVKALARRFLPHQFLQETKRKLLAWNSEKVEMPIQVKESLTHLYRDDLRTLGELLRRDLTSWAS